MNRGRARIGSWVAVIAACALCLPAVAEASRRDRSLEGRLMEHIKVLASDDFEGREPGTEGEARTLRYLGREWFDIGLVSGTNDPGNEWFAPVTLVERVPAASTAQFKRSGRRLTLSPDEALMLTSGNRSLVRDAPVLFVGTLESDLPGRSELAGRVALLLDGGRDDSERQNALLAEGASAVLTVLDGDRTLQNVAARRQRSGYALAQDATGGDLEGFVTSKGMDRLLRGSGTSLESLEEAVGKPQFAPHLLGMTASLEATTQETTIRTHNLIGKLPGRRPGSGAVLFVSHWDHFGVCSAPPPKIPSATEP